jgi:hypothetical protein
LTTASQAHLQQLIEQYVISVKRYRPSEPARPHAHEVRFARRLLLLFQSTP